MPISNSYPSGIPIEDPDLFVGTKAANNRTVNYTAQGIANYLNINSKVAIGGQMSFQFTITPNIPKTIAFDGGLGDNTAFSAITKLIVSAIDVSTANITIFLNYLNNSQVLLSEQNQPNFFGHYKITGYTQIGTSAFYELDLEFIGGNGTIVDKQYYDLVSFVLSAETSPTEWGDITGDIEDQTDLIDYISSQVTTPTLQEVLDNNHDLVDGNNFQGTDAGLDNTGTYVIALGGNSAKENTADFVNAFGWEAANGNTGTLVNAIGGGAAVLNEGNDINALGTSALVENQGNDVNALGWNAGIYNTFDNVNLLGRLAAADEDGQTVLSKDGAIMARISTTDLTETRKYNLPDDDGILALTSDITAATNLENVTTNGKTTTKGIKMIVPGSGEPENSYLDVSLGSQLLPGLSLGHGQLPGDRKGFILLRDIENYEITTIDNNKISIATDTSSYNYLFNKTKDSGTYTLATLEDIPSYTTPTLQQVTDAGNLTTNDINLLGEGLKLYIQGNTRSNTLTPDYISIFNHLSGIQTYYGEGVIQYNESTFNFPTNSGTIALTSDIPAEGVTSVGLTMPSAFSVTNSPITSSGDIAVTGAGLVSQYVRGDGTLANFPNSTGGGSSVNYFLNGSVSQGTFGGTTYYQMSKTPILGAGTNFTRTNGAGNGYIASFITDAGDPSQLNIPGGNWNVEFYFNASSGGGSPSFYAELYKVSATNVFTLIASDSLNPEGITNGTTVDQYFTSIPVPQTTLLVTDRLAVRIFVNTGSRTITLHTENGNLSEVLTTFTTGLTALNGLTDQVQFFDVGTTGTDFNISSVTDTHTFNLPDASATARGVITTGTQTIAGQKTFNPSVTAATAIAKGTILTPTLIASANNDVLVGLDIAPTFTNGAFTGVTNYALRVGGSILPLFANSYSIGTGGVPFFNGIFSNIVYSTTLFGYSSGLNLGRNGTIGMRIHSNTNNVQLQDGGTFTDVPSSRLTINSTTQGFLPPRMTTTQRNAIASPATGLIVYDTTLLNQFQYNGTAWVSSVSARRNANNSSNNNINYCGIAANGSAEASAVWTITRLTISGGGAITVGTATNVAWTDRETTIYI